MKFAIVEKETGISYVFRENTELSAFLNVSVQTIIKKKTKLSWDWKNYTVYNIQKYYKSNRRGGKRVKKDS